MIVYNYLMRIGSITQSIDEKKKKKVLDDKLLLIDSMQEQMKVVDDKRWFEGMIAQTALSIIGYVSECFYSEKSVALNALKEKKVFPLSSFHSTKAATRKIRWANVSPGLLCCLIHCYNVGLRS